MLASVELRNAGMATTHANSNTTVVRMAVARFEFTPATPAFASTAVAPANKADNKDQPSQFMCKAWRHCLALPSTVRRYLVRSWLKDTFAGSAVHGKRGHA